MSRTPLGPILDRLRGEPSRTWSIIITVYGDAIVPRGGSVWLGTLLAFFNALHISGGVVRTAMSRLASDGWLKRNRIGRHSFYRLTEKGCTTFSEATNHIYGARPRRWSGHVDLILLNNGPEGDAARAGLEGAGFGSPSPGLWVLPAGSEIPRTAQSALKFEASGDLPMLRALVARSWPLETIGHAYQEFIKAFEPMRSALKQNADLNDLDALAARVLLIHEYRRIILRDPILPAEILPEDWPGDQARALCANLYRQLVVPSERWLDANARDENGTLPPARHLSRRFRG